MNGFYLQNCWHHSDVNNAAPFKLWHALFFLDLIVALIIANLILINWSGAALIGAGVLLWLIGYGASAIWEAIREEI